MNTLAITYAIILLATALILTYRYYNSDWKEKAEQKADDFHKNLFDEKWTSRK